MIHPQTPLGALAALSILSLLGGNGGLTPIAAQSPAAPPSAAASGEARDQTKDDTRDSSKDEEESVKPGINETFLDPSLDVPQFINRFEVESREVFRCREQIHKAVNLRAGQSVADIGTGTGLFVTPFARAVGPDGKVFAVDIAPRFIEHVRKLARVQNLSQVEPVLCRENSVALPANSIDVAFVCDTYHHFEYPKSTLASIAKALRPGGTLVIVDFERIPGVSSDWIMGHVRAGKDQVRAEIEDAGFTLIEEVEIDGLTDNYCLRFKLGEAADHGE